MEKEIILSWEVECFQNGRVSVYVAEPFDLNDLLAFINSQEFTVGMGGISVLHGQHLGLKHLAGLAAGIGQSGGIIGGLELFLRRHKGALSLAAHQKPVRYQF